MEEEKQIEEMAQVYDKARLKARDTLGSMNQGEEMWYSKAFYKAGYRKQNEVIDEFAKKLKDYPIEVRLPLLGLETKEEIEMYVNNLFDQIESIIDKIAKEMKGE